MISSKSSCPYCEKVFTDTDDVVYCPECGTPHHRACYTEHGKCANGEKHAEGFVWKSENPEPVHEASTDENGNDETRCPGCGAEISPNALICTECGMRLGAGANSRVFSYNTDFFLKDVTADPNEDLGGFTVKEAAMFTQTKASDYIRKFLKQKKSGKNVGWNWAAFLFSPLWFFYRKLYKAGICFVALAVAASMFLAVPMSREYDKAFSKIEEFITITENTTSAELAEAISLLSKEQMSEIADAMTGYFVWIGATVAVQLVLNCAAAVMADGLYRKRIAKDITTIKEFSQNQRTFEMLMLQKGGTSVIGMLGGYCFYFLLNNILLLFNGGF